MVLLRLYRRHQRRVAHQVQVAPLRTAQRNALHRTDSHVRIVVHFILAWLFRCALFDVITRLVGREIIGWRWFFGEYDSVVWFIGGQILEVGVRFAFDVEPNDAIAERLNGSEIVGETVAVGVMQDAEFFQLY